MPSPTRTRASSTRAKGDREGVRRAILDRHHGELLVGAADVVETGSREIPYLIAAPTMRVPMILQDSVNAYLAARAAFLLVARGRFADGPHQGRSISEKIGTVALPGMGTGVGRMGYDACARQVRAAMPDAVLVFLAPPSWDELVRRLIGRGTESQEEQQRRLVTAKVELAAQDEFDARVVNSTVAEAAREVVDLMEVHARRSRRAATSSGR